MEKIWTLKMFELNKDRQNLFFFLDKSESNF